MSTSGSGRVARREVLQGGLGVFAALVARSLPGCGDGGGLGDAGASDVPAGDAGASDVPAGDGGVRDVAVTDVVNDGGPPDGGDPYLTPRTAPPPPPLRGRIADIGPLGPPDMNGVRLPPGFTSRVIARTGQRVGASDYEWHLFPDGGATYATDDGGWIYVSNSETPLIPPALKGGVGAVRFDREGRITSAYRILDNTSINCAGGKTPWNTWLSCEEFSWGRVWECDPWGERPAVPRPALGVFKHEAAAVDPRNAHVYLTEDERDGRFYRFIPRRRTTLGHPDLSDGVLEVAELRDGRFIWHPVPDPLFVGEVPTREQVPVSTAFNGGEGAWWHDGTVFFTTKGDNKVWAYEIASGRVRVIYDARMHATPPLRGVDNLTVSCCGNVLVAEDGGTMQVVAVLPDGRVKPLVQVVGHDESEICGPAFDPSGTRLYFSSQRGPGGGWTFEVQGPFHEPLR
jgi:hypothetical protein